MTKRNPTKRKTENAAWWKQPTLKQMAYAGLALAGLGIIVLVLIINALSADLPNLEQLETYEPRLITKVLGKDGTVLKELYTERRVQVPLDSIAEPMLWAILSTEDKGFYDHWGISPVGIIRAAVINTITMSRRQGASTITQQLARNLYLHRRRTYKRKIREIITAIQIEKTYAKDEILQMYFTQMYFGHGAYGVQAAAKRYFGVSANELSIDQSAMLVGLLKAPTHYSPYFKPDAALLRRNVVLNNMWRSGFIAQSKCDSLKLIPIELQPFEGELEKGIAPYFTEEVRQELEDLQEVYGFDYYRDGLIVQTTLDPEIQAIAEAAVDSHLVPYQEDFYARFLADGMRDWMEDHVRDSLYTAYDSLLVVKDSLLMQDTVVVTDSLEVDSLTAPDYKIVLDDSVRYLTAIYMSDSLLVDSLMRSNFIIQVSFVAMDPQNGDILAMIGGRDFNESKFNRAVQSPRQPGSVFKPFVYTTAIDNGIYPNYKVLNMVNPVLMPDGTWWRPENYSTQNRTDRVSLREGLRRSLNNVTVRLVAGDDRLVPPAEVVKYAHRMGITTRLQAVPSIALGSIGVLPIDVVTCYSVFASGGMRSTPRMITSINDRNGNNIVTYKPEREIVLSPETAYIMVSMLQDVVDRGTGGSARWKYKFFHPAAGKTGTTNNFVDAWFVGFTPRIVAGVRLGFDDPKKSLGKHQSGSRAALPIWAIFMRDLHEARDWERMEFEMPIGVIKVPVCEESGELAGPYCPNVIDEVFREGDEPFGATCSQHRVPGY